VWRGRPRSTAATLQSTRRDKANSCHLCQADSLVGLEAGSPGGNVDLTPSLTGMRTDLRPAAAKRPVAGRVEPALGVDARWSITPELAANLTANPDFSQVEADVGQLDANEVFALRFPERRPFFLEGADLFLTPQELAFTRTIADPSAGAKLTGKLGANAFGVLAARDAVTSYLVPGHEGSAEARLRSPSTALLARYRRDVGRASTAGALLTSRTAAGYANQVLGADLLVRPHPTTSVAAQVAVSTTDYPDSLALAHGQRTGRFGGALYGARATYRTRHTSIEALGWRYTRSFRADLGFVSQVGVFDAELDVERSFWGAPGGLVTRLGLGAGYYPSVHDTTSGFTNAWRFVRLVYEGPGQLRYQLWVRHRTERYRGTSYRFWTPWMGLSMAPSRRFRLDLNATLGRQIDYRDARLARIVQVGGVASLRPTRSTELALIGNHLRLSDRAVPTLRASVAEIRGVQHFSERLFLRAIVQRAEAERLAPGSRREVSVRSHVLLSYRVNAQTAALLGYGDERAADPEESGPDALQVPLRTDRRTFFTKVSYLWRP
jgi:hypothetical protein